LPYEEQAPSLQPNLLVFSWFISSEPQHPLHAKAGDIDSNNDSITIFFIFFPCGKVVILCEAVMVKQTFPTISL